VPVKRCQENNMQGFKWGNRGKCFTYRPNDESAKARARARAEAQGRAIAAAGGEKKKDNDK